MPGLSSLRLIRPLPKAAWNSNCSKCDKPQARWHVRGLPVEVFVCGICVLYESPWGTTHATEVSATLDRIEAGSPRRFARNQDGKLSVPAEADDVLGVLLLTELTMNRLPRA